VIRNLAMEQGRLITHDYPQSGRFTARVFIFNDSALIADGTATVNLLPPAAPPTAAFRVADVPDAPAETAGRAKRFDGSLSVSPGSTIIDYVWDFGDGSPPGGGVLVDHVYGSSGRFTVRLTVTTEGGATGEATESVLANLIPRARFSFQTDSEEPPGLLSVQFDASESSDPDGQVAAFDWDFGDGSAAGSGVNPRHTYERPGRYDVRLQVSDDLGSSASTTQTLDLRGSSPFLTSITPEFGEVDTIVTITNLAGFNFPADAGVLLRQTGGDLEIEGQTVLVVSPERITCTFALSNARAGEYDVVLRSGGADVATLPRGFRVVSANRVRLSTSMGDIVLELDRTAAPGHVANFLRYVDERRYDNVVFHRVVPEFVIQGGGFRPLGPTADPRLEEQQALPTIASEAPNGLSNVRGTISLALRGQDANSGSSQFFINLVDNPGLDEGPPPFTVFGRVAEGLDVVDRIGAVMTGTLNVRLVSGMTTPFQDVPLENVVIFKAVRE
jgi:peptidyl-prolyl cis-trans isomerase A (cyclophilin A)